MGKAAHTPRSPDAEGGSTPLTSAAVVLDQLRFHALVRFGVVFVVAVGAVGVGPLLGAGGWLPWALGLTAVALVVYNVIMLVFVRRERAVEVTERSLPRRRSALLWSILADDLALTVIIWGLGGARSPFLGFYLLNIIVAAFLLSRRGVALAAGLGCVLASGIVLAQFAELVPRSPLTPGLPLDGVAVLAIIGAYCTLFLLSAVLLSVLARALRDRELEVQQLSEARERAGTLNRQFLLITLHNLNSPIAAATTLLRNLHEGLVGPLSDAQGEQVARSLKHMDVLRDFLHDLRTVCGLETGDISVQPEVVDVPDMLRELVDELRDLAGQREHRLEIVSPETAPPRVRGVKRLIQEAIANYITNAIKYTPPGGTITVRSVSNDGWVRVEVEDTGVGIEPDDQARLFTELVRIKQDDPRLGRVRGTGLGLSIVRRIIRREGGRVGVESEPGRGSTFWLELPKADES
jgi:signal transduction histidine kinase